MKKKLVIVLLAVICVLLGGLVVYLAMHHKQFRANDGMVMGKAHYTAYEQQKYPDLTYAAENAVRGVVNVEVTQLVTVSQRNPLYDFFGIPGSGSTYQREILGGGSGVIITSDGYIVTNNHVVENASKLRVKLYDQRTFDAIVIGADPASDIALIKIDAEGLPVISFGDSDALRLGEWVLAIGSPFDLPHTITAGIVSAKARNLGAIDARTNGMSNSIESFIQTDAAINPGNSGGALVNTAGQLIGINTLIKASNTGTYMGYSFAVPSAIVQKVVTDIKEYGVVQRAVLGVAYALITNDFIENFGKEHGITEPGGAYVSQVDPNGAAYDAGIREGDIIAEINGIKVDAGTNISEIIGRHRPNDKINISVKRGGIMKQFDVVLRNKAGKAELLTKDYADITESLGGKFAEISDRVKKSLDIGGGVQITAVKNGSILSKARIKEGFIITSINDKTVRTISDLDKITLPVTLIEGVYPNGQFVTYSIVQ